MEEQIVPAEEITTYEASLSHGDLSPYDPEADQSFKATTTTGPFALRVKAFRLLPDDETVVELEIDVTSGSRLACGRQS